jgi:hypothetical protein
MGTTEPIRQALETVTLGASEHTKVEVEQLGVTVERGYLFWCRPDSKDAIDCSIEHTDTRTGEVFEEPRQFGYFGSDVPTCEGEYVATDEKSDGYLVIYGAPECEAVDGWSCELADDLSVGWHAHDGTWRVVIVKEHGKGEYTICGSL